MILSNIALKARDLVNADTSSYPDANLLNDINIWYQKVATMILEAQTDADFDDANQTDYPIYTSPLIAGQRDYPIPATLKMLEIKRLDVTYDGSHYYRALPFDNASEKRGFGPLGGSAEMDLEVDRRYIKQSPRYDVKYNSIFMYPLAVQSEVDSGAKIVAEFTRQIIEFTSAQLTTGTISPGFDAPFHAMLSYGPAFEFAQKMNLPQAKSIFTELQDYEVRLKRHYANQDKDFKFVLMPYDIPEDVYNR